MAKSKKSKKKHNHKERKERKRSKKLKKVHKSKKKVENLKNINETKGKKRERDSDDNFEIPVSLMNSKSHAPETPKEYQRRQNKIRRETDPLTGRSRLIRGSEIIEGIVSKQRQAIIKKEATEADGNYFQESISCQLKK